ncbi:MAG: hypothetical protein ABI946_00820 [Chthoniobacterales bacterium]
MSEPSEPDDSDRLRRLRELNRKLDQIIRDGDAKLHSLEDRVLAHSAQSSYAVAIENIYLQRTIRKLTIVILVFTIIAALAGSIQATYAVLSYYYPHHQLQQEGSPPQAK